MATTKEVKVVINGEEKVSEAASSAETGMMGFVNKIPGWAQAAAVLTVAWKAISTAVDLVSAYVMDSIERFDAYMASQTKLSAQSKLTGVSLTDLKASAQKAREEFGLSATVANDAATTVAKYASRAGDATLNNKLMAAALDLGAASGLTAAQSMEALEQGLRGQDEGFDKLLGKNPSTLWKEYADANDLAVGKMTDTEKRMAELTAVVEAGNVVQGSYNERMASGAGEQEKLNNKLDMAKVAFGEAIQPIRIFVIQGLGALLGMVTPVIVALGKLSNFVGEVLVGSFALGRTALGSLVEGIGKLTGSKSLEEWGARQVNAFPEFVAQVKKMHAELDESSKAADRAGKAHTLATIQIVASAKANATETVSSVDKMRAAIDAKLGPSLKIVVKTTEEAIGDLAKAASTALPPSEIEKYKKHMEELAKRARELEAAITGTKPPMESNTDNSKKMWSSVEGIARGAIDAAQAFGAMDSNAASTLTSVVNIASSIGRIYSGDIAGGAAGLMGGIANLVAALRDTENKRIVNQLTFELNKLRMEVGNLDLNVSGDDFNNTKSFIEKFWKASEDSFRSGKGSLLTSGPEFLRMLSESGMTLGDLERVANEMGLKLLGESGNVNGDVLRTLLERLNATEFGTVGQGFESQLEFFRTRQRLEGSAGTVGGMQGLFDFLRNAGGVSALNGIDLTDPNARNQLLDLFTRLNNGGVGAGEIGRLTGSQFSDLLEEIIQSLGDGLAVGTGPDVGTGGAGNGPGGGETGSTSPTITTGQMVSDAITAQTDALQVTLEAANGFHTRIADATESTAATLLRIEEFLQTMNWTESVDRGLARSETLLAFQQGRGLSF